MASPISQSVIAYIGETFLTIKFDKPLSTTNPPSSSAFSVDVNGTSVSVNNTTIAAGSSEVIININVTLLPGDIIDYFYNDPSPSDDLNALQGTDGSDVSSFNGSEVVAVSRPVAPVIISATYDASTGALAVTGSNFSATAGSGNDIDTSKFTLTGEGGNTYTLTSSSVEITSSTAFSITLNATDKAALNQILNKNGTSSTSGTTYNIAASNDWNPANAGAADLTGNGITVSNVVAPTIVSATYDANTGVLAVTGNNFSSTAGSANDIDISKLTLTGQGGSTYTLTSSNVDITSSTAFSVTLNATDQAAIALILDKIGTASTGGTTYNIAAASNWNPAITGAADLTGNGITVLSIITRPTVSVRVADTALRLGETSLVTFTFSEAVSGFSNADLTIPNGTLSSVSSSDGGITWTATLTPTSGISDATNVISVDMTGIASVGTSTAGIGSTDSNNYRIDTLRPTATILVADTALKAGETSAVTVTFSEAVTGFTNADLAVENGSLSAVSSADGGITWTTTFTPTAGVDDTTNLITLDNTGISDAAGNTGTGTTNSSTYAIDTKRPTATIAVADTALKAGETSAVTITFSEAIAGLTTADFTVENGSLSAVSSADGGITWTTTFTPTAGVDDTTNLITLDNTGVSDAAGNAGTGTTNSNNYAIDTKRPTATIVVADTALKAAETSAVTITFSEAVTGLTTADLTVENGSLSAISSSDGGITWTSTFTPAAGVDDTTNLITLDNTGISDGAGNAGTGTTNSNTYAIDTKRPTATIVVADTALKAAETSAVTITFSEAVTGFSNADLTIENGSLSAVSSSDGGITWGATFTATANLDDNANVITLDNTGVTDLAGNSGSSTTDSNNYVIDVTAPTISAAKVNGKQLTLTFTEPGSGLDQLSTGGKFTVSVGTQVIDATTISLDATAATLSLSLATAILSSDQPTLAYSQTGPSSAAPIQDKAGNLLASFSGVAINNESNDGNGLKKDSEDGIVSALKPSAKSITKNGKTYYDTNGDGRTDIVKVGSQLFGDLNGDGVPDVDQSNVASIGYIKKSNYQLSNDSNPLTSAPASSLVSIVAGSKVDQPDQRLNLSGISVESPTENSRPNPLLAATTIYPMGGSTTVAGSRIRADRTWDALQFTVGFDPLTGANLDVDKNTKGIQVDILIDISRYRASVGFFNAYLKWDPSANANKGGWVNFMRQQGKGDGAEYLDLNRDGLLDAIRLRLTDNGLGDIDNRVGFISDPGMPSFIAPQLTAQQQCFVNLFASRGSSALMRFG